jgi:hypothetical protein
MTSVTEKGVIVKGYKATDNDIKCIGYQFTVGEWHEHEGEISLCSSGFHFCEYPSGPWCYYGDGRMWNVEAEFVLKSSGPGSDLKHVAKRIRLVSEIKVGGNGNTGDMNTGDMNTGDWNTGYGNTGDWNTGYGNTGNRNTGNRNTGNRNTGNRNTGNRNTGNGNTGNGNTGDCNTGNGNCGSYNQGMFCIGDGPFFIFGKRANRSDVDVYTAYRISCLLSKDEEFDVKEFLSLPNATESKIKKLHKAHIAARKKLNNE